MDLSFFAIFDRPDVGEASVLERLGVSLRVLAEASFFGGMVVLAAIRAFLHSSLSAWPYNLWGETFVTLLVASYLSTGVGRVVASRSRQSRLDGWRLISVAAIGAPALLMASATFFPSGYAVPAAAGWASLVLGGAGAIGAAVATMRLRRLLSLSPVAG